MQEEKIQKKHYHSPQNLFCHYKFATGNCTNEQCKFKHELFQKKYAQKLPENICPNGIKCPINHKNLHCPIEKENTVCHRKTQIINKSFRCEYKHTNNESIANPQKQQQKINQQQKLVQKAQKQNNEAKIENENQEEEEKKAQENIDISENLGNLDFLEKKFKIYKVPKISETQNSTVLGVLDQSGSMSSCWRFLAREWNQISQENKTVTVTFHSKAMLQEKPLEENPEYGGTEIEKGFQLLNQIIKDDDTLEENLTIIFVSDGADNNNRTIKQRMEKYTEFIAEKIHGKKNKIINMINVGVGKGFPTFLSMQIRETYHNGDNTLPSVFLIENAYDENQWKKVFQNIKTHLNHKSHIELDHPVSLFPWDNPSNSTIEDSFVFVEDLTQTQNQNGSNSEMQIEQSKQQQQEQLISVKNSSKTLEEKTELTLQEIIDIVKTLLNFIQVKSLQNNYEPTLLKLQAKKAHEICVQVFDAYKKNKTKKITLKQKIDQKQEFQFIEQIISSLKQASQTNILANLTEEQAAKRLAIGTNQGKYHQKALEMAGLDARQYNKIKNEFIEQLEKQISEKKIKQNKENQLSSFMTLQTQREAFLEEGFIDALKLIENQYEMVELFPLLGQSLFIRRTDGSMINPYLISVQDIARHHDTIDINSIISTQNLIEVSIGNDQIEQINAVLPLFDEDDEDLAFFYNSEFFQFLMTFNACQNADTILGQSYKALLVNTLINVLNQKDSEWKENFIKRILTSYKVVFGSQLSSKTLTTLLIEDPYLALQPEINEQLAVKANKPFAKDEKCPDLSLAIAHILYLKNFDAKNYEKIDLKQFQKAFALELYARFQDKSTPLHNMFTLQNEDKIIQTIQESLSPTELIYQKKQFHPETLLKNFQNIYQLNAAIEQEIHSKVVPNQDIEDLKLHAKKFLQQGKLNLYSVKKIMQQIDPSLNLAPEINIEILNYIYAFTTASDRYLNLHKLKTPEKVKSQLKTKKFNQLVHQQKDKIRQEIQKDLETLYLAQFSQAHQGLPDFPELQKHLKQNQENKEQIQNNEKMEIENKENKEIQQNSDYLINDNGLPKNACVYKNCPHYLQVQKSTPQHLEPILIIRSFNKACRLTALDDSISNENVFLNIIAGKYNQQQIKQKFTEQEEKKIEAQQMYYIQQIKELRQYYAEFQK